MFPRQLPITFTWYSSQFTFHQLHLLFSGLPLLKAVNLIQISSEQKSPPWYHCDFQILKHELMFLPLSIQKIRAELYRSSSLHKRTLLQNFNTLKCLSSWLKDSSFLRIPPIEWKLSSVLLQGFLLCSLEGHKARFGNQSLFGLHTQM